MYRPSDIQFSVDGQGMPENLGFHFENATAASEFIGKHTRGINSNVRASRYMDNFEKRMIREDYQELLEDRIPMLEKAVTKAKMAFELAKKELADAQEAMNATHNEAVSLAKEVKRGIVEMELDDLYTWKVPVEDRYYFYTFIDNQIKLCKITDIPAHEKGEIFNVMHNNREFFSEYYPGGSIAMEKFSRCRPIQGEGQPSNVDTETGEITEENDVPFGYPADE